MSNYVNIYSKKPRVRFNNFSDDWNKTSLTKLIDIHARIGWQGLRQEEFMDNGEFGLITGTDFTVSNKVDIDKIKFISKDRYDQDKHIQVHNEDILLTKDGSIGKVAIIENLNIPATLNAGVYVIRANDKVINQRYLYHYLKAPFLLNFSSKVSTGGTIKHLNQNVLSQFKVPFPSKEEQIKIVNFLNLIDNRIDLQINIIEKLERIILGITSKMILNPEKNWKEVQLNKILNERKEYSIKCDKYTHVTLSKTGIDKKSERYDRDFLVKDDNKKYKICKKNDICYNPANLKFGVICLNTYGEGIFSPIYVTFEVNKNYDPLFISLILTNPIFINKIRKYEQGTVYERMAVSSDDMLKGKIFVPDYRIQCEYSKKISLIKEKIKIESEILKRYQLQKDYFLNNMFI